MSSSMRHEGSASVADDGDGDGASPDAATTDRNNNDNDATPSAADNASTSSSSSRSPPLLTASQSAAIDDDDRRRRLPRVLVMVEERIRWGEDASAAAAAACESPMTPMTADAPAPADVPRGCCPVYVGAERRRFVVPTAYLGMPVFRRLLEKAEGEVEFHYHGGAVTIPCDTEAFKYILVVMDRHRQGLVDDDGNDKNGEQGARICLCLRVQSRRFVRPARDVGATPRHSATLSSVRSASGSYHRASLIRRSRRTYSG